MNYKGFDVQVEMLEYAEPRNTALLLVGKEDSLVATATVNTDELLPHDYVAIKNYSENTGMTDWLVEQGVIHPEPRAFIESGFVLIGVYELTEAWTHKKEASTETSSLTSLNTM